MFSANYETHMRYNWQQNGWSCLTISSCRIICVNLSGTMFYLLRFRIDDIFPLALRPEFATDVSRNMQDDRLRRAQSESAASSLGRYIQQYLRRTNENGPWRKTVYVKITDDESRLEMTTDAPCINSWKCTLNAFSQVLLPIEVEIYHFKDGAGAGMGSV